MTILFTPFLEKTHDSDPNGTQKLYKFDNGYGASVIRFFGSYGGDKGLWEIAVIKWDGDTFEIDYSTPITDDVIGWLTEEDVEDLLNKIKDL